MGLLSEIGDYKQASITVGSDIASPPLVDPDALPKDENSSRFIETRPIGEFSEPAPFATFRKPAEVAPTSGILPSFSMEESHSAAPGFQLSKNMIYLGIGAAALFMLLN